MSISFSFVGFFVEMSSRDISSTVNDVDDSKSTIDDTETENMVWDPMLQRGAVGRALQRRIRTVSDEQTVAPDEQRDHLIEPLPHFRILSGHHRIQALWELRENKSNFTLNWCASLVERGLFPDGIELNFTQIRDVFSDLPDLVAVNDDEFSDLPDLVAVNDDEFSDLPDLV